MSKIQSITTIMRVVQDEHPRQLPAMISQQVPARVPAHLQGTVREAAALILSDEPQAREYTPDDLIDVLYEPLSGVAFLLGHKNSLTNGQDLDTLAAAVAEMIQRKFPAFRLSEICLALRRGASGEFRIKPDEVLLPSLPCITQWLQAYHQSSRAEAMRVLQAAQQNQQQRLSLPPTNLESTYPQQVAELARMVQLPEPLDPGNVLYDWLKKIGAFTGFKTPRQFGQMMIKESWRLLEGMPPSLQQFRQFRTFREQLRQGWPAHHPMAVTVLNNCGKRLLREWLRYHGTYHGTRRADLLTWLQQLAQQAQQASK